MMATGRGLSSARLVDFGASVLHAVGVPIADARLVAHSLVEADLWGHRSHGMLRLSWYVGRLQSGAMRAVTEPETVVDGGAVAVLDGRDGVGQVLAMRAMREAIECARRRRRRRAHSNHFGTAAYFTRVAASEGKIGILTTHGSPAMAPWEDARRPWVPTRGRLRRRQGVTTSR